MKFSKLVIASNGENTAALLDGVFFGRGLEKLVFSADADGPATISLMELNVRATKLDKGKEAEERFEEFVEWLEKKNRPCGNKDGLELTE